MILSRGIWQQPILRAVTATSKKPSSCWSRAQSQLARNRKLGHVVPQLTHGDRFSKDGIPDLLSAPAFKVAWTDYQEHIVNRLNRLTAGSKYENSLTKDIAIQTARDASQAACFNYASMAHNNHFFFTTIAPNQVPLPAPLLSEITQSFTSISSLRTTFLATANAMFGPGFVWLVHTSTTNRSSIGNLALLTTYLAGSPYPGAHFRQQGRDLATADTGIDGRMTEQAYAMQHHDMFNLRAGSMGFIGRHRTDIAPGGQDLTPLLCVSTWEHSWLTEWGVAGKEAFLQAWWDRIDWEVVEGNRPKVGTGNRLPTGQRFLGGRSF